MRSLLIAVVRLAVMMTALIIAPVVALVAKPEWRDKVMAFSGYLLQESLLKNPPDSDSVDGELQLVDLPARTPDAQAKSELTLGKGSEDSWSNSVAPGDRAPEDASFLPPEDKVEGSPPASQPGNYSPLAQSPGTVSREDRLARLERRLQELGATYYRLEAGGEGPQYWFTCRIQNAQGEWEFKASANESLRAMEQVLHQVEGHSRVAKQPNASAIH